MASTPTFSRTIPLAWEEPPKGEDLKAVPRRRFLKDWSAHRLRYSLVSIREVDGERVVLVATMRAQLTGGIESSGLTSAKETGISVLFSKNGYHRDIRTFPSWIILSLMEIEEVVGVWMCCAMDAPMERICAKKIRVLEPLVRAVLLPLTTRPFIYTSMKQPHSRFG